ncbi:MAG: hypothetical protein ABGX12_04055 [Desulfurobacteriaceae bacterium]
MERKEKKNKNRVVEFVKSLPEGRRLFFNFGSIMVEVTKEEALKLLEEKEEEK